MNDKQLTSSYQNEVNQMRSKLSQLEVNSIEQKATDEVRQWRQKFDTSTSRQLERMLDELEKQKLAEVSSLANELRTCLDEFRATQYDILDELEVFISKIGPEDEIQWDFVKFRLDSINKKLNALHMDITVKVDDGSQRRRSSTALARNKLNLAKVFNFEASRSSVASSTGFLKPFQKLFDRASSLGASYYQIGFNQRGF